MMDTTERNRNHAMAQRHAGIRAGLCWIALAALPSLPALGQNLKTATLECKSENFQRTFCSVGAPVQKIVLVEKKSNASCVEGTSFGISGNHIWADKGCQARFEVTFRDAAADEAQTRSRRVRRVAPETTSLRCSSVEFRRSTCDVDGRIQSVKLTRQRSQARCVEGTTFGFSGSQVWVDQGCDGDFQVQFIPRSEARTVQTKNVTFACKSVDNQPGVCYVSGSIVDVRLQRKRSRASCDLNKSYGFRDDVLWVRDGCEGDFEVTYRPGQGTDWGFSNSPSMIKTLTCKSDQFREGVCKAGGEISGLRVLKTRSRAKCTENKTYGFRKDEIWVTEGCEADFEVLYFPRP